MTQDTPKPHDDASSDASEAGDAALVERAKVVAWMEGQIAKGEEACLAAKQGSRRERDLAAGVVVLTNATAAIKAGDHLQAAARLSATVGGQDA